ncbi:MAG: hypothetical protein KGJ84_02110 [Elusimicrobia bacterium]|nr:hypothetical protein [Elusimicrobiota bacterium]
MNTPDTKACARSRVAGALDEIERAQEALRRAAELLCPILGFVHEWEAAGKLHQRVKAHWHKVNVRARSVDSDLDESARAALAGARSI